MGSRYDDELWELVPDESGAPPAHLRAFVAGLPPARSVLDLGGGDGRLSAEVGAERLVVADVSAVALARAARRVPRAELVELTPGAPLPFADGRFDLVLCTETLEHVQDVQGLLSEVRRVLLPGGHLALSTPAHGRRTGLAVLLRGVESELDPLSPHLRFFSARSLAALLDAMGFDLVTLRRTRGTLLALARR